MAKEDPPPLPGLSDFLKWPFWPFTLTVGNRGAGEMAWALRILAALGTQTE